MEKTYALLQQEFESSSQITQQYVNFVKTFNKEFKVLIAELGGNYKPDSSNAHFEVSGFFSINGKCFYFSSPDLRMFSDDRWLFRTAQNDKDYSGGINDFIEFTSPESFKNQLVSFLDNYIR